MANNAVPADAPAEPAANNDAPAEPSAVNNTPAINEAAINLMTVSQLNEQLKNRKLSQSGVKAVLQQRLLAALTSPTSEIISSGASNTGQS